MEGEILLTNQKELQTIKKVLLLYKLSPQKVFEPRSGYRNKSYPIFTQSGLWVNLILFKVEEGIVYKVLNANRIGAFLNNINFPSRESIVANNNQLIKLTSTLNGNCRYACLYNYLPGNTIPWDGYTSKHIKLLGGSMGEMHKLLESFPNEKLPDALNDLINLCERMKDYFLREEVQNALEAKLRLKSKVDFYKFDEFFKNQFLSYQSQAIHLDFVRGNILFLDKPKLCISGIIDFEKAAYGPKILDIARTLAFLIVDCKYKSEEKVRKYFLKNGYEKRGQNQLPDLKLLEELLNFYWIYDFYKFLKHNPYESLSQNEHFIGTRDILVNREQLRVST